MREKEDQASQDLIKKILEEEQEQELQQEKADEQLARKLSGDFKHTEVFSLVTNILPLSLCLRSLIKPMRVQPDL